MGVKPRRFCSRRCLREHHRPRKPGPSCCEDCGSPIQQPTGKGRKKLICLDCREGRRRNAFPVGCATCGTCFRSRNHRAKFCSAECRWPRRPAASTCLTCNGRFQQGRVGQKFCSRECGARSSARRHPPRRRIYQCLHCGSPFNRRPYRTANKYCCRECAFDARRARATKDNFGLLAAWFLNWGADASPPNCSHPAVRTSHKARCRRFRVPYEPVNRAKVFAAAGWRCAICGCELLKRHTVNAGKLDSRSPTIDCIVPLSAGPGSPGHVRSNVQACCHSCNVRKSNSVAPQDAT